MEQTQHPAQPAISLRGVTVGWGSRIVLPRLHFEVAHGEVSCLVGPGGSGKSTLLRAIEALVVSSASNLEPKPWWSGLGRAAVGSCARLRQHGEFRRESVGELLTALDLAGLESWVPLGTVERTALQGVRSLRLEQAPDPIRRFLSFGLVACSGSPLLLLDEPLFGLRGAWAEVVRAGLCRLADGERTLVLVTHHLPLAREMADRVTLVVDGEVVESSLTEEFFTRAQKHRTRQFVEWGG